MRAFWAFSRMNMAVIRRFDRFSFSWRNISKTSCKTSWFYSIFRFSCVCRIIFWGFKRIGLGSWHGSWSPKKSMDYFLSAEIWHVFTKTQRLNVSFSFSDYVYFESSSTSPFTIRRIEELNKVSAFWLLLSAEFAFAGLSLFVFDAVQRSFIHSFIQLDWLVTYAVHFVCFRLQMEMWKRRLCVSTEGEISPTL